MRTLSYAMLGLLAREPLSGYEIAQRMKEPIGFFWHAGHSQIYPELARMEQDGLVTHQIVEQHDRPDKKVYTITEAGREALRRWVAEPAPVPIARDVLVLKAYSLWLADPVPAAALFREHERRHREQLAAYEALHAHFAAAASAASGHLDAPDLAAYATLRRGIGYEREYADWCTWVAEHLEARAGHGEALR